MQLLTEKYKFPMFSLIFNKILQDILENKQSSYYSCKNLRLIFGIESDDRSSIQFISRALRTLVNEEFLEKSSNKHYKISQTGLKLMGIEISKIMNLGVKEEKKKIMLISS